MYGEQTDARTTAALGVTAAASLVLSTGCMASTGGGSGDGETVTFAGTGGVYNETLKEAAWDPLEEETGISVADDSPNNEAKLQAMVESGNPEWDVFYTGPQRAIPECGVLFEELDFDAIDTSQLPDDLVTDCSVPIIQSTFMLVYNTETYPDDPPQSWADFYDTENYPGTRGIMNYAKDAGMETALLGDGVAPEDLFPLDYERAFDTLDSIRDDINFYETGAQQEQALESGEVDMMLAWPARAHQAAANGAPLEVVWDQPYYYTDSLAIVKGSSNADAAAEVINSMVSPQPQEAIAETLPYVPVNEAAEPEPDEQIQQFYYPEHENGTEVYRDEQWWADNLDEATEQWNDWANQ